MFVIKLLFVLAVLLLFVVAWLDWAHKRSEIEQADLIRKGCLCPHGYDWCDCPHCSSGADPHD